MNKIKSRKLWAFLIWTILALFLILTGQSLEIFIPNFMVVTALYIGGQSAVDAVDKYKH